MNKIKFILLTMVLASASVVLAQGNPNAKMKPLNFQKISVEQRAKNATDTLQKVVGLTDAQYQKVYSINLKYFTEKKEVRTQMRTDTIAANVDSYKEKEMQAAKLRKSEITSLLTAEQQTKWQGYKKKRAAEWKSKGQKIKSVNDSDDEIDGM